MALAFQPKPNEIVIMAKMSKEKKALGLTHDQLNPGDTADARKYSDIVYQTGGESSCGQGVSYKSKGVWSKKEREDALNDGWFATPVEAVKLGESEANKVRFDLKTLREEKMLEKDRVELEELRKEKAESEAKKAEDKEQFDVQQKKNADEINEEFEQRRTTADTAKYNKKQAAKTR